MRADLHTHARPASRDSRMGAEELAQAAAAVGLDAIALTDHGPSSEYTVLGSYLESIVLIPGREVSSPLGHVIVLATDEEWLASLAERAVWPLEHPPRGPRALIWAHPAGWRSGGAMAAPNESGAEQLDGVEVLNGERLYQTGGVEIASGLGSKYGLCETGGSDAHDAAMVGRCLTIVDGARNAGEFIEGIATRRARAVLSTEWAATNGHDYRRADLQRYLPGT